MSDFRINAGELRRRVRIETEEPGAASPMGSVPTRFVPRAKVAAKLTWLTGDKLWQALQVHPEASVDVLVRWHPLVQETGVRFVDEDGNELYPVNCVRDERKRWMRLLCKEHP